MSEEKEKKKASKLQDLINLRSKVLEDLDNNRKLLSEIEAEISRANPVLVTNQGKQDFKKTDFHYDLVSSGIQRLDDLLGGGLAESSNVMLSGPPYSSKYDVANSFIVKSLSDGYPVIVVSLDRDVEAIRYDISSMGAPVESYEERGFLKLLDAYSKNIQMDVSNKSATIIDNSSNFSIFLKAMDNICAKFVSEFGRYRMVFFSLTGWITQSGDEKNFPKALQHFSQRRKLEGSTTLYLIEDGIFEKNLYENMNYFMDGSIEFRTESSSEYIRVRGMKRVRSRDWIELMYDGNGITLGSFELKRIK